MEKKNKIYREEQCKKEIFNFENFSDNCFWENDEMNELILWLRYWKKIWGNISNLNPYKEGSKCTFENGN